MQLHAVIVPPPEVVQDALEAARSIRLRSTSEPAPTGLMQRLFGRTPAKAPEPTVNLTPAGEPALRLTKFGNVTSEDAQGLIRALGSASASWSPPLVNVSGLVVDPAGTPLVVTAQLGGDTDALFGLFRKVNDVASGQGFFLDRRSFRAELVLASVDLPDGASPSSLVVGDAETHEGPAWLAEHVSIMRTSYTDTGPKFQEVARLTLGAGFADATDG